MSSHNTHPHTNVSRTTTSLNMGMRWMGDPSGEENTSETPDETKHGKKEDRDQVRTCIELSYAMSDNIICISISQTYRSTGRTKRTYDKIPNPNTSFSDPVDVSLSETESFAEDDMYGSDDGMETISESSDDRNELEISQSLEGRIVSACASSNMSNMFT